MDVLIKQLISGITMKHILGILLACAILGCTQNHKKKALLGNWYFVSSTDMETGAVELPEQDNVEFVRFGPDSLYLMSQSDTINYFAWRIKGDSILLNEFGAVYIKALTKDQLIVEYDFFGMMRLELTKRKNP